MIKFIKNHILLWILFLCVFQECWSQNNTIFDNQDCNNLINTISKKNTNTQNITTESYINNVLVPSLLYSMKDVMKRNNIKLGDKERYTILYNEATNCAVSSIKFNDEKSKELFRQYFVNYIRNTVQNKIFKDNYNSE
jgi:hypothetical protein